jgi:uracil phosphoribosyltransferase
MKIYLANDHTGVAMKQAIAQHLTSQGHEVINLGTDDTAAVNYASQGKTLGLAVANDSGAFGIGICGTGIGISIAANKVQGIIAGLVYEPQNAIVTRQHNNANIMITGARQIAIEKSNWVCWCVSQNAIWRWTSWRTCQNIINYGRGEKIMSLKIFNHPLILDKLTRMRRKETSSKDFRENLNEIAELMVFEVCRDIPVVDVKITTPVAETIGKTIDTPIVLVPILRAGLGMTHGIQQLIPTARIAHVGLYRDEETLQPIQYYAKETEDIDKSIVLVVDPMLATGGSASAAIDIVKGWGAKNIRFVCLVAVQEGVDVLTKAHPDVDIYAASLDEHLNEHGYIIPGLGDAGDRIFGTK